MSSALDLMTLDSAGIAELIDKLSWPHYRAEQLLHWIYQRRLTDITAMTDLSKADRARLAECACISSLMPDSIRNTEDGTQKFVFALEDRKSIETVVIPDEERLTVCLSTQVGCTLDCAFCLTGRMGLLRNLKAHEIVGQVLAVQRELSRLGHRRLTNVVLMGMGEPLANIEAVEEAIRRLTDTTWGIGFSPRRITLSTAGLATRLARVANLGVNLAVSLNATTDAQRSRLMPAVNRAYPLDMLMKACRTFPLKPRRHLTFEYVLLEGENDTERDAVRLAMLTKGIRCKINLIPFNEFPGSGFRRPSDQVVLRFQAVLDRHDIAAYIRKSKGREILGACGQLGTLPGSLPLQLERPATRAGFLNPVSS